MINRVVMKREMLIKMQKKNARNAKAMHFLRASGRPFWLMNCVVEITNVDV